MLNYAIKFQPILKEKIWGGNKLKEVLNKKTEGSGIGESWEISGVPGNISVVANGGLKGRGLQSILSEYGSRLVGKKNYERFGNDFPLLIKFIDAKTELSVQLHPHDELAKKRHDSFGKTEMWYIMQADEGADINIGFKQSVSEQEYMKNLEAGTLTDLLHFEKVKKGDAFFIQTGKVHAIGAGVLLAEIQQTSDITYRIYDWDRVDENGIGRELHTELAMDAIDFERKEDFKRLYSRQANTSSQVASCEYFTTNFLPVENLVEKDYTQLDSFVIYMCVDGDAEIDIEGNISRLQKGETLLIPAENKKVKISGKKAELLEVYID